LRAQLALFGIAAADQHETRRVAHRKAFALHHVLARCRHVQQQIDQVILQQVDLVDIEKAAMRAGEQARFIDPLPGAQRALQVERAEQAVFGGAQRQIDERHRLAGARTWPCLPVHRAAGTGTMADSTAASAAHDGSPHITIAMRRQEPQRRAGRRQSPNTMTPPIRGSPRRDQQRELHLRRSIAPKGSP
jgi:hypothetical protein